MSVTLTNKRINMRKIIFTIVLIIGLLLPRMAQAQSTLYVSNLGQTPTGSMFVGRDSWIAQIFFTGTNSSGYNLNSVQLLMNASSGSPSGFNISIYSSLNPTNNLGNLSGPDPLAGGLFTYTASNITLSPSTDYYVVVTAETTVVQGDYDWSAANNITVGNNGWIIGGIYKISTDGSNWDYSRQFGFQLGIYATAVPEPATYALAGLGLAALSFWRRKS